MEVLSAKKRRHPSGIQNLFQSGNDAGEYIEDSFYVNGWLELRLQLVHLGRTKLLISH
jgi:hypothetical protein